MQSLDNAISIPCEAAAGSDAASSLSTEQDPEKPNPTFIEVANKAAEWLAGNTGGIAQSMVLEALANIPTTAHILGGAVIGKDASAGVVDRTTASSVIGICSCATAPRCPPTPA